MTDAAVIARAEVVGSLLRPDYLREARERSRQGGPVADLRAAEDRAILEGIAAQQAAGVDVVSDGEMRRGSWIATVPFPDLPAYVTPASGFTLHSPNEVGAGWVRGWRDHEGNLVNRGARDRPIITQRLQFQRDIVADELGFLRQHTTGRVKFTFPAPSYYRVFWHPELSKDAYPTVDDFLQDICRYTQKHVIRPAIARGCDYIQMDAPNYGQFYTDPEMRASYEAEGHDLDANLIADAEIDNAVFTGITGATRALHVCRGNGPGGIWSAAGGYDVLAPVLFPRLTNVDTLLLEYDSPRAGDFSPLRHVLPHATVVLGLLTTKSGNLEDPAVLEQRIREAAQHMPLHRLALSPQCGFNSSGIGNPLTQQEQQAKMALVTQIARKVWPES